MLHPSRWAALSLAFFIALAMFMMAHPASAKVSRDLSGLEWQQLDQSMGQGGPEFKAIYNTVDQFGMMVGGRGVGYMSNSFYLGGAGYGGTLNRMGRTENNLVYAGLVAGLEDKFLPSWGYDASLLVGAAAAGTSDTDLKSSMVLEPRLSLSNYFGGGVRTALSVGYLYFPNTNWLSGPTLGLRVEFKTLTLSTPVDD
ncbi:hypothetical protein D3C86_664300 [compost metagenome]